MRAAEKLGFAIKAAIFGCAASAANAFWFDASADIAADCWLIEAKACGLTIIADAACGLPMTACIAEALILPAAAAEAASELALNACSACDAELSWAAFAALPNAEALWPIADIACGLI